MDPRERKLRGDADAILRAAREAVDPGRLVSEALRSERAGGASRPAASGRTGGSRGADASDSAPALLAVGKAAVPMVQEALRSLPPDQFGKVLIVAPEGSEGLETLPSDVRAHVAGHPLPTPTGVRAAREVFTLLQESGHRPHVMVLLSGGASALLSWPAGDLDLDDLRTTTEQLLRAGASIGELNTVRKHLERTKGGRLAAASATRIRGFLISDVIGDDPSLIGSGPFSPDPTTFGDALDVLEGLGLGASLPRPILGHLSDGARGRRPETPKPGDPCFDTVELEIVGSVATAVQGALAAAARLGYRTHVLSMGLAGEAREVGRRLGALARAVTGGRDPDDRPICLIAGGETTVTVTGTGRGGRNQELVLASVAEISGFPELLVASLGTDGVDGPTDAAGAMATGSTLQRARALGLDPERALRENDSHPFFRSLGDLIVTGPTGTNVMDLQLVLVRPRGGSAAAGGTEARV